MLPDSLNDQSFESLRERTCELRRKKLVKVKEKDVKQEKTIESAFEA